jgi:glycosyltransferase involved in cell wall biosynthesis
MRRFLHVGMSCCPNGHGRGLETAMNKAGWEYRDIQLEGGYNRRIQQVANDYKPELVFIQIQDKGITRESIQVLKANGAFILNWSGDLRAKLPECYAEYVSFGVDLTCFSNMWDVDRCPGRTEFLQIGYDPAIYYPGNSPKDIDIVFMGNYFTHFPLSGLRHDMVKELKRCYGERFKVYGIGQSDGSYMGDQPGEAAIYRRAKIGINLSHFSVDRYTSDRMFRMLGSGVCVLSHKFPDVEQDFGNAVVLWNDINELKWQINRLLADELQRKMIAQMGHKLAMERHTFEKMGNDILELYRKYNG